MKAIRLFTSAFPDAREWRRAEYAECLLRNLSCSGIDEVVVFAEDGVELLPHPKLAIVATERRPTYGDYLARIRERSDGDGISIIANSDIYFDDEISMLRDVDIPDNSALALARWDVATGQRARLNDRNDSQDAWIFVGKPRSISAAFPVGVPRCDNRFAKELENAGYLVLNPSFSVRAYHLHDEQRGEYPTEHREGFVEGPYGYVWPHNLLSLPLALLYKARHQDRPLPWRFDIRFWQRLLQINRIRAVARRFGLRSSL